MIMYNSLYNIIHGSSKHLTVLHASANDNFPLCCFTHIYIHRSAVLHRGIILDPIGNIPSVYILGPIKMITGFCYFASLNKYTFEYYSLIYNFLIFVGLISIVSDSSLT